MTKDKQNPPALFQKSCIVWVEGKKENVTRSFQADEFPKIAKAINNESERVAYKGITRDCIGCHRLDVFIGSGDTTSPSTHINFHWQKSVFISEEKLWKNTTLKKVFGIKCYTPN